MTICVFCGSNFGDSPIYMNATIAFAKLIAARGLHLVYGGGNNGLMGVLADTVLAEGGRVTGVIPEKLVERERAHKNLSALFIVKNMHERKAKMAELSDGFVALPGGLGTLDEFCEIVTWNQLGFLHKPAGILNVEGFYTHFIAQLYAAGQKGFISQAFLEKILIEEDATILIEKLFQNG